MMKGGRYLFEKVVNWLQLKKKSWECIQIKEILIDDHGYTCRQAMGHLYNLR